MTNSVVLTEEMIIAVYDLFDMIGHPSLAIYALVHEHDLSAEYLMALLEVVGSHFVTMHKEDLEYDLAMSRAHNAMLKAIIEIQEEQGARLKAEAALRFLELEINQRKAKEHFMAQGCSEFVAKMKTAMLYVDGRNGDDGLELA